MSARITTSHEFSLLPIALFAAFLYAVWKIVPAVTSRLNASTAPAQSSSTDVGSYGYSPWMRPSIPYPDQGDWNDYNPYYQDQSTWKNTLAQAGANAGLQAAQYYWPSAFGGPSYPPDGGGN